MVKKLSKVVAAFAAAAVVIVASPVVHAADKVTICHGTNSVTNPYVKTPVDADAADGNTGNDNGQGDHSTHTGPVATSQTVAQGLKDSKTAWGDIIPSHDNYGGLNWTAEGQAIYNNGCNYVTPGSGGGTVTPSATPGSTLGASTTSPSAANNSQVKAPAPGQGVNAGGGGAAGLAVPSIIGLLGSLVALGYGIVRFRNLNS